MFTKFSLSESQIPVGLFTFALEIFIKLYFKIGETAFNTIVHQEHNDVFCSEKTVKWDGNLKVLISKPSNAKQNKLIFCYYFASTQS